MNFPSRIDLRVTDDRHFCQKQSANCSKENFSHRLYLSREQAGFYSSLKRKAAASRCTPKKRGGWPPRLFSLTENCQLKTVFSGPHSLGCACRRTNDRQT